MQCPLYNTARQLGLHPHDRKGHSCYVSALGAPGGPTTGAIDDCTRHVTEMYHTLRSDEEAADTRAAEAQADAEEAEKDKDKAEETLRRSRMH